MSLWVCPEHGMYGGQLHCPSCGLIGDWVIGEEEPMFDAETLRARLAFIRQGSEVERFHTKRMIQRNDVGHHSFHVAWLAHLLAEGRGFDKNPMLILAALAHDLAEHITGDMPGDFKREMGIREQFSLYEYTRFQQVGLDFESGLSFDEKRILKLADMMEGAFFCISEASLGNHRVGGVFKNFRAYITRFAPFNDCEAALVKYIDELWYHYGKNDARGWDKTAHTEESMNDERIVGEDDAPELTPSVAAAGQISRGGEVVRPQSESLSSVLKREEAEGRATPPPLELGRTARAAAEHSANPSEAVKTGDAPVPEQPVNDASDDRASRDLPDTAADESQPANARQYGGDHYKGTGYEHWDLVLDTGMNYFQGCATKYVTRARKHSAGPDINLLKAIHYVDKAQEAEAQGRFPVVNSTYSVSAITEFGFANGLNPLEVQTIMDIIGWRWDEARRGLVQLRSGATEPVPPESPSKYYGQVDGQ